MCADRSGDRRRRRDRSNAALRYQTEIRNACQDIDDHRVHLGCTDPYLLAKMSEK
jgi:hypothetical protein